MKTLLWLLPVPVLLGLGLEKVRPIPADSLPTPLERVAPLGAEELAEGWQASDREVSLGRKLFFDPLLSTDSTVACASCHRPEHAFGDDRQFSVGIRGQLTRRNSPSLMNRALSTRMFWDGRATTLEEQVLMPIQDGTEMGTELEPILQRLAAHETYAEEFRATYGEAVNQEHLASALAAFVRALAVGDSPVDRFRAGDTSTLNTEERAGMWVFEGRGGCWKCHTGPAFSDEDFHNTGVGAVDGVPEPGLNAVTGLEEDRGKFRTPGLRLLTRSAPYMHDGSLATLEEVIEFYRQGGHANDNLSPRMDSIQITDADAKALVAFLEALSR